MNILEAILEAKRKDLSEKKKKNPLKTLKATAAKSPSPRDFKAALCGQTVRLIGEIKKASPSVGVLREDFDPATLARRYESAGASALSVLTDVPFFQGSLSHLKEAKQSVSLPVLRKDFILEAYQLYESAAASADAVLLIAAVLEEETLAALIRTAGELGMAALAEVHSEEELEKALRAGAELIGVNNRDLNNFTVDLGTSGRLIARIPKEKIAVSESGIRSHREVAHLASLGFRAVLIGRTFMERPDMERAVAEVMGW